MGGARLPAWSPLRYTAITCTLGALSIGVITAGLTVADVIQLPTVATIVGLRWTFAYLKTTGSTSLKARRLAYATFSFFSWLARYSL